MQVQRVIIAPYSDSDMFALVDDIESYPQFIPWCDSVQVQRAAVAAEEKAQQITARINIVYKGIKTFFTTANLHTAPSAITMKLHEGALASLHGEWRFIPLATGDTGDTGADATRCRIEFDLHYAFGGGVLGGLFNQLFNHVFDRFADHFTERAKTLYGEAGRDKIAISVVDAPHTNRRLLLPAGATVADALERAGYANHQPVGMFGKPCAASQTLAAGDRVEIYHPLPADPRAARRERVKQ